MGNPEYGSVVLVALSEAGKDFLDVVPSDSKKVIPLCVYSNISKYENINSIVVGTLEEPTSV